MAQWLIFVEAESYMCAKSLQSCQILCDPVDSSPPGSSVYGISRQEQWSRFPCPPPGKFPNPGTEPASLISLALAGGFFRASFTWSWIQFSSVQFSCSVMSNSLWPHGLQHSRLPCPSPTPGVYSNSCPLSWWCHPTISSSVVSFSSHLQSFPASESFQKIQFFTSVGQSIGVSASASVLPMNIQDWFLLGWTGWIILQSKGLSRVFSNTTVQKHQFFGAQLSLLLKLISINEKSWGCKRDTDKRKSGKWRRKCIGSVLEVDGAWLSS